MIDANAYSLAINWALHEIKAQIRDTERERDFKPATSVARLKAISMTILKCWRKRKR